MKALIATVTLGFALCSVAYAGNAQQERMKDCNAQAKTQNLAGPARKDFMKSCLSAARKADDEKKNAQQEKMKKCNADAKSQKLKGADRKKFMSSCLSG